jgi:hypothetical protein
MSYTGTNLLFKSLFSEGVNGPACVFRVLGHVLIKLYVRHKDVTK